MPQIAYLNELIEVVLVYLVVRVLVLGPVRVLFDARVGAVEVRAARAVS